LRIVGLGGSLAARSRSRTALETALAGAFEANAETELLDIRELDLPLYNPDAEPSANALAMVEKLESADGLLWSSPLYQGSVAGSFKNALDWLHLPSGSRYLTDKAIGTGCRRSTRWSSRCARSAAGPCRTWCRCPGQPSTTRKKFATRASSGS
jgi:NAD(P)H-dependent FMN reductase